MRDSSKGEGSGSEKRLPERRGMARGFLSSGEMPAGQVGNLGFGEVVEGHSDGSGQCGQLERPTLKARSRPALQG